MGLRRTKRARPRKNADRRRLFQADLEKVDEIQRMFREVEEQLGSLYGLVNNAARFRRRDPLEITEADWDFIHSVNLKATFFCCQQGALLMKKSGAGRIVNISSLGGIRPWDMYAHYCASKAGVIMLTRALAKAFAPEITVNSVAPGVILASSEDPRAQDLIAATPAQALGHGGRSRRRGAVLFERVEFRHRPSAGGRWRLEPALVRLRP